MKEVTKIKDTFFASCPVGIEEVLELELKDKGIKKTTKFKGGVQFECYPQFALNFILHTKLASRVYKTLFHFVIKNEDDLYYRCKEIKWKAVFNLDQTFKVQTLQGNSPNNQKRSKFKSSIFLSQKFKDGIVDNFRETTNKRPDVDTVSPNASLLLRVTPQDNEFSQKEDVSVLIDLCGEALSKRGYKVRGFKAPLRENLASAIVALTEHKKDQDFLDLMSGSGTLVIEAALRKGNIPGAYLQILDYFEFGDELGFNFTTLNLYTKDKKLQEDFKNFLDDAHKAIDKGLKTLKESKSKIIANDIDKYTKTTLLDNIESAKLEDVIEVYTEDATSFSTKMSNGIIIANPPYGERLGVDDDLESLYHDLGENLKQNFKNNTAYIFTGNLPLIKKISLQTSKKIILFNGNIESRLVEYKLF